MLLDEGLIAREGERWKPDAISPMSSCRPRSRQSWQPGWTASSRRSWPWFSAGGIGRIFSWAALRAISPKRSRRQSPARSRPSSARRSSSATLRRWRAEAYRFGHIRARRGIQGLPKEKRAELHERSATFSRNPRATAPPSTRSSSVTTSSRRSASGQSSGR
jgi:hypothetical protein